MDLGSKYFSPSFSVHDTEGIQSFFNEQGFVVIDNVLNADECFNCQQEVWSFLAKRGVSPEDSSSWENENWPKEICRNGGFMGKFPYFNKIKSLDDVDIPSQRQAWLNRENPLVYKGFSTVMGIKRLWSSIDRYGVMRPTVLVEKDEENKEIKSEIKFDWKTKSNWLHWDLSPFHYGTSAAGFGPNTALSNEDLSIYVLLLLHQSFLGKEYGGLRIQGLITLVDCPVEVGGFHCVPKFHGKQFFEWGPKNEEYGNKGDIRKRNFIEVPEDDEMRKDILKVPMRAGSLLIWNSQLPHGNFPNSASEFRMVQYIKMISVDEPREFIPAIKTTKHTPEEYFPKDFEPTDLGKKLFGMKDWEEEK